MNPGRRIPTREKSTGSVRIVTPKKLISTVECPIQANVTCAISTDAMDQLEGSSRTPPAQREQQFLRLRDRIEARASRKFSDVELEGNPPGVILRAIDFRPPR